MGVASAALSRYRRHMEEQVMIRYSRVRKKIRLLQSNATLALRRMNRNPQQHSGRNTKQR